MNLFKNTSFLKIFSIANLLFLSTVLFLVAIPLQWSFDFTAFIVIFLFLITAPVLYAFNFYFTMNKNIVTFIELFFGLIFIYQIVYWIPFPFLPILTVLGQEELFLILSTIYKIFFASLLLVFCSISTFYTFKYLYVLKHFRAPEVSPRES